MIRCSNGAEGDTSVAFETLLDMLLLLVVVMLVLVAFVTAVAFFQKTRLGVVFHAVVCRSSGWWWCLRLCGGTLLFTVPLLIRKCSKLIQLQFACSCAVVAMRETHTFSAPSPLLEKFLRLWEPAHMAQFSHHTPTEFTIHTYNSITNLHRATHSRPMRSRAHQAPTSARCDRRPAAP